MRIIGSKIGTSVASQKKKKGVRPSCDMTRGSGLQGPHKRAKNWLAAPVLLVKRRKTGPRFMRHDEGIWFTRTSQMREELARRSAPVLFLKRRKRGVRPSCDMTRGSGLQGPHKCAKNWLAAPVLFVKRRKKGSALHAT